MAKLTGFIGVDTSLAGTGVAMLAVDLEATPHTFEQHYVFTLTTVASGPHGIAGRLHKINTTAREAVETWLDRLANINNCTRKEVEVHVAIEGGAYNATGKLFQLGAAWGAAITALASLDLWPEEYAPAQVKAYMTGNYLASKEHMAKYLKQEYSFASELTDDNQIDAVVLALLAYTNKTQKAHTYKARMIAGKAKTSAPKKKRAPKKPVM